MKTYHEKWLSIRENSPNLPGSIVASMKEKTDKIEQNYLLKFLEKTKTDTKAKNDLKEQSDEQEPETEPETVINIPIKIK